MAAAVSLAVWPLMSTPTTLAPSAAKAKADALPMPWPAPVTSAILSDNCIPTSSSTRPAPVGAQHCLAIGARADSIAARRARASQPLMEETAMGQYSKAETEGHLLIVTINRPEVY